METAQRHPPAVVKRRQAHDLDVLSGALGPLTEVQLQLFLVLHSAIARFEDGRLADADVAEAADALATSLETAERGVLFEPQIQAPAAESLRRELKALLSRLVEQGGRQMERDAAVVLRGMARGAAHQAPGIGDGPVDYLTLVARLLNERPPDPQQAGSRIILP